MSPLTESARTEPPAPSITVRSPETEWNRRSPVTAWASMLPETVSARTAPVSPTSVLSPETPRRSVRPRIPETTALGADHADLDAGGGRNGHRDHRAAVPAPAVEEASRSPSRAGPRRRRTGCRPSGSRSAAGPSISHLQPGGRSSVPTTLTVPPTMRTWSAVTGSSKVSFWGSATVRVDSGMDRPPHGWRDATYRVFLRTRYIAVEESQGRIGGGSRRGQIGAVNGSYAGTLP